MKRQEEHDQVTLVAWFRIMYPQYKSLITTPSFGENIGSRRMARLKEMGLTPGMPDIHIAVPKRLNPNSPITSAGLYIEMKTETGKVTERQADVHAKLLEQGYTVKVCRSVDEGMKVIKDYFD